MQQTFQFQLMPAERRGAITGATSSGISAFNSSNSNMAFNFGSNPAPAPAGGFSFGSTPAPAPAGGGFGFASPTPAAPAGGSAFSFGGTTPAPAPSTGGFGAPSPAGGGFGTSTPAPSSFGAPAGGSLFGAPSPAPAGSSLFGAPAPAGGGFGFGAPAPSAFGQTPGSAAPAPPPVLAGNLQYSALPPDQKQAIDRLYQGMMQHKRTLLQASSMAPKLLGKHQQADMAAGTQELPLASNIQKLSTQVGHLQDQIQTLRKRVDETEGLCETSMSQTYWYAKWPTEAIAARRGVQIEKSTSAVDSKTHLKLQEVIDKEMAHVDRVELIPSPYLWQVLEDMERRIQTLKGSIGSLHKGLQSAKSVNSEKITVLDIVNSQENAIIRIANSLAIVHEQVERLRADYRQREKGTNVLDAADQKERQHQQYVDQKLSEQMVKAMPTNPGPPAPSGGGLFGSTPAPAGGLFGSAPAPSGGLFGSSPAPSSGAFGFGSTPAPAASGGLFGSTPAPSSAGLFGSTPAPAPAPGAIFGASTTPASAPSGGLFGAPSTTTPASSTFGAPAGAFGGATTPALATFGGFATTPAPSSSSSTPKSKNKSRGTRRR